jgi:hypothetical protein
MAFEQRNYLEEAMARVRSRASWNSRLEAWEKPASDHEEQKIERAASMARAVVGRNPWLKSEGVSVVPQGSYFNNTNVRLDADMDLRVQHPTIRIEYAGGVEPTTAFKELGYFLVGRTHAEIAAQMRRELYMGLVGSFGAASIELGSKAMTVSGLSGTRADCDLVPVFKLHYVRRLGLVTHEAIEGVAILGTDGIWTFNYPDQHHTNGIQKRARTQHRFKKNVRMLKRLNTELAEGGFVARALPSFLVECLVYVVEDFYFLVDADDRYERLRRILTRLAELLDDSLWWITATEINGVKPLFLNQPWGLNEVKAFVRAALDRLEFGA